MRRNKTPAASNIGLPSLPESDGRGRVATSINRRVADALAEPTERLARHALVVAVVAVAVGIALGVALGLVIALAARGDD